MTVAAQVEFRAVLPWAILPKKKKIDVQSRRDEAKLMEENFRFVRRSRSAELCWPWRMGQEIGWVIESPVTVTMNAIHDVEAICLPEEDRTIKIRTNCTEAWTFAADGQLQRIHFTRNGGWIGLYEFRSGDHYETMFYANGEGTVEWVMGWDAVIPQGYFLMLLPADPIPNLEIVVGVLDSKQLKKPGKSGLSIAIKPTGPVTLQRGQPIARMILLHGDSVKMKSNVDGDGAATAPPISTTVPEQVPLQQPSAQFRAS